ncbi:type II toxin-antitoxin system VapC family toxin [Crenothrix sp.]|uniref:type II toxin-antitoxin system VapC family toxin n=1 Tax=Crenothrix sp. TaxID=3100433 RepID=UPI00374DAA6A
MQGQKVYLDANIFIYTLEGVEPWVHLLTDVFTGLTANEFSAVTSSLSLSECLVLPFKQNKSDLVAIFHEALLPSHYLTTAPIDDRVLISAANIRAQTNLKLPDAIHAATALTQQCTAMLTNDPGFKRVPGIELFLLSDWISSPC